MRLLDQIDDPRSSRALADLAVTTRSASVRGGDRDPQEAPARDYAGHLVEMVRAKIRYQVQPVEGPGSSGSLTVETPRSAWFAPTKRLPSSAGRSFHGYVGYDANGLPVIARGVEMTA